MCEGIENIQTKRNILAKFFNGPNFKEPIWGRINGPSVRVRRSEFQGQPGASSTNRFFFRLFLHFLVFQKLRCWGGSEECVENKRDNVRRSENV
jgi:hypothetical protein